MFWNSELLNAAGDGNLARIKECLANGADIETKDGQFSTTALALAANQRYLEMITNLANGESSAKSERKQYNNDDKIALIVDLEKADLEAVESLVGDDDKTDDKDGATALMLASWSGHLRAVKFLIEKGANLEAKNNEGETALMWASSWGRLAVVRLLIERGANINAKNCNGETALMFAVSGGHLDIVRLLVANGADIADRDSKGRAVLELAKSDEVRRFLDRNVAKSGGGEVPYFGESIALLGFLAKIAPDSRQIY